MKDDKLHVPARRTVLASMVALGLSLGLPGLARADQFPSRPITLVVTGPAGSQSDILMRMLGRYLQKELGQPVVIENRPGAGGHIAGSTAARAKPDGYTLLFTSPPLFALAPILFPKLAYKPQEDLVPIGFTSAGMHWVLTNPEVGVKNFDEFLAYAKAKGSAINYASGGVGHPIHLFTERLQRAFGLEMTHVPYTGMTPAVQGVASNDAQLIVASTADTAGLVKSGKLQVLATAGPIVEGVAPAGTPSLEVLRPELEFPSWYALFTRAGTPAPILDALNAAMNRAAQDPEYVAALKNLGNVPKPGSRDEVSAALAGEIERTANIAKIIQLQGS